jgi:hypothetical protein
VKGLVAKQTQIRSATAMMRDLLDGQYPATKDDLQAAQSDGLLWGLFIGILASLIATWVWVFCAKFYESRKKMNAQRSQAEE